MPPPIICNILPTYLSTDLVTPGRRQRETLPAIGTFRKSGDANKLWGQETKLTSTSQLAYHCFKPSHLKSSNVVVTHRHYGDRINNMQAKLQPAVVTTLLLSKCRHNDQRMPPPFHSSMIQDHYLAEPCPAELRNSYFSHRCKFQVFPTDGTDLLDTGILHKTSNKELFPANTNVLRDIKSKLYGTTTYQRNFEENRKKANLPTSAKTRKTVYFKVNLNICRNCGLQIKRMNQQYRKFDKDSTAKLGVLLSAKKTTWPCWPPGGKNTPPCDPKIILPKYCIHPVKNSKTTKGFCKCAQPQPYVVNRVLSDRSKEDINQEYETEENIVHGQPSENNLLQEKQLACGNKMQRPLTKQKYRPLSKQRCWPLKIEPGFKTEAHQKFHQIYNDVIPDLRDAAMEGKKHNFHGFNVHLFRG